MFAVLLFTKIRIPAERFQYLSHVLNHMDFIFIAVGKGSGDVLFKLDFVTLSQRRPSTVTNRTFARLTIKVRLTRWSISKKSKLSDMDGIEKTVQF